MLTLTRRWRRSIYSLGPRRGKWGINGPWPDTLCIDRHWSSDGYRTFGGSRGSGGPVLVGHPVFWLRIAGIGFLEVAGRPVASDVCSFGSGFRLRIFGDIRTSDRWRGVRRPVRTGHPAAVASGQLLLLFLALSVLAVFSMVFLLVPGHA